MNKTLISILIFSFLASLFYSFYFKIQPAVDAKAYDVIAVNIVNGNGYRESLGGNIAYDPAVLRAGPLYEYFLAGIYKIFGHHYEAVWVLQALLHLLTVWLVYLTVLLIFSKHENKKKLALWSAAIIGFYPDLIEISAMLMTETFYLFLVCAMFYLFFRYLSQPGNWLAVALGIVSGLAILARPPVLFVLPVLLFYFLKNKKFPALILFLIFLFIVFMPWTIRNYNVYGTIMPFGVTGNLNFWIGNYHGGSGEQGLTPEQQGFVSTHTMKEVNSESINQFKNFLLHYPGEFIKLTILRINKYFSVIRPMGFWFYQKGWGQLLFVFLSALASVFLFVFGLAGFIKALKSKNESLYYLLAAVIFTPLILFVTVVETRYRFQIYPFLAILAGYFLVERDKTFWLVGIIIFLNGAVDLLLSIEKIKERLGQFL
ncbi:MAG: oligosaccharyl transferase STT3 subunit [Parcubacteria group bacterium Athens0714_24]|nr:MAG: oligosaccharyl transferase STT3 subunit [Parcubacteria group bacterium Athens0714_24]